MEERIEQQRLQQQQPSQNEAEIDLRVVFGIIRKNLILIVIVTVIFGIGAYFYSSFFIAKQYSASATIIVNNKATDKAIISTTEINAAQDLANVYSIIIKSDTVLQQVIDNLQLNMSYESLNSKISVSSVNSTQVMQITMTHTNPEFAQKVVAEIVEVAPPIITDKVEAGSVKVISASKISNNGKPVSPSLKKNALIGALAGMVLVLLLVFLKEMTNNTFKNEDDIINTLNVPLIGIIPESGPHLLFVTLFAAGAVPFSVLLASSISQDGHAGLPLLAETKRGFLKVKLINVVVALACGFLCYALGF